VRAWQVTKHGEPRNALRLMNDAEVPDPGPGQLRVRVLASAVGFPDVSMCRGSYALTPPLPFTPGQEISGVVTAAGAGAQARVGDRVMAVASFFLRHGGFAEECLALDDFAFPVPEEMEDAEAAGFVIPFHTAYVGLLRRGRLEPGETVAVLGAAGGSGSAALQLAKAVGAHVIATAGGPAKAAFCAKLGADVVIDHSSENIADAVREATGGRGADVIFDAVGGEAFDAATRCIAHEGRLLVVGFASGSWGRPRPAHLVTHNYSLIGVMPSGYDRPFKEEAQAFLLEHWRSGGLRTAVHEVLPFEQIPDAVELVARRGVMGKLVVQLPTRVPGAGKSSRDERLQESP
jgi:NADPH2:quinone reductase